MREDREFIHEIFAVEWENCEWVSVHLFGCTLIPPILGWQCHKCSVCFIVIDMTYPVVESTFATAAADADAPVSNKQHACWPTHFICIKSFSFTQNTN